MLLPRDLVRHPPTFCLLLSISLLFFGVQKNMRNMKFPQPQFGSLPNCVPNSELFYRTQHTPHILPGCPPPPYRCHPFSAGAPPPSAVVVATLPIHPGAGMLNAPPAAARVLPAVDMPPAAVIA